MDKESSQRAVLEELRSQRRRGGPGRRDGEVLDVDAGGAAAGQQEQCPELSEGRRPRRRGGQNTNTGGAAARHAPGTKPPGPDRTTGPNGWGCRLTPSLSHSWAPAILSTGLHHGCDKDGWPPGKAGADLDQARLDWSPRPAARLEPGGRDTSRSSPDMFPHHSIPLTCFRLDKKSVRCQPGSPKPRTPGTPPYFKPQ
ncbi:B-cell lymphoma/leukemia 11B [Frankliniella fusca]|uniref:B-cell lymphoma/leukemia 11B n=1 Tax=Frankliniella fusca TaxID=407009 RepID=A0AAE1I3E8_9NEOP|nr:B-cell lymphoma/leukemia 11B [Frankliniella fusca]